MFSREEIIKKMLRKNESIVPKFSWYNPEMHQQIIDSFNIPDLDKITAYYCWYHQIEPKICPTCGTLLKVNKFAHGYSEHPYCGKSCWPEDYRKEFNKIAHERSVAGVMAKYGVENVFKVKEIREAADATIFERYGVVNANQSSIIKEKTKKTNFERYGVENQFQSEEVKAKIKATNLEKYGVEHPMHIEEVKDKIKKTNIERFGVENPFQNEEVKAKIKAACFENYGVDHPLQSDLIKTKIKQTNIEQYGVDNQFQSEEVKAKIKQTNVERYGAEWYKQKHLSPETLDILNNHEEFKSLCEKHEYNTTIVGKELGTTSSTTLNYMRKHELDIPPNIRSYLEQELIQLIESLGITNYVVNDRKVLNGKEIDLYLPEYNLGIEMDGVYWHSVDEDSEINKKNHHRDKVLAAREKGIKLIQFYEDEWNDKRLICESIIKNALGLGNNKLYARKLSIKEIPSGMAKTFCDNNHLSGGVYSKINLGLFDGSILVQVATFSINRFSKDKHWELIRLCSAKNTTVVGGASRLIKKFFEITDADELTSFSDNRIGQGNVYKTIGFELVHETSPGYFWFVDHVRYHRMKYQKHKLVDMDGYSVDKTEDMIMFENGHRKIYDSGNRKWRINNNIKATV